VAVVHGGENGGFTTSHAGANYLNLIAQPIERRWTWWGRVIFYESDVDGLYARGHELSFAWPLGAR